MSKSIFIASSDNVSDKQAAALAAVRFCSQKAKIAYFKPVAKDANDQNLVSAMEIIGLKGAASDFYGLSCAEALDYLNQGKKNELLDIIYTKYVKLAFQYDFLVIEGLDVEGPASQALANLDANLAAHLASLVILLTCGCGGVEMASLAVSAYKAAHNDVFACVVLSKNPADAASTKELVPLQNTQVWAVATGADITGHLATAAADIMAFNSKLMTPKRFEFALIERAKSRKQRIVLPEGNDARILKAADEIISKDFADLIILGDVAEMKKKAQELGLANLEKAQLINHKESPLRPELAKQFYELRKAKGVTEEKAFATMDDRNFFATMMVKAGHADGMVSGADGTTADTIRPALSIIKTKPGCSMASSVFFMCLEEKVWVFGDCAINTNPTPQQLAEIAIISAQTGKTFGVEPKVAMLSYSTGASGTGVDVEAVKEATQIAKDSLEKLYPGLALDGPLQFDAAVDPATGKSKMPGSQVAGQATVMVFPDLNSGNIGYKAVQRTAGAVAIGPIIQGLNAPVNDLSRGCLVADIVNTVAITACQAQDK